MPIPSTRKLIFAAAGVAAVALLALAAFVVGSRARPQPAAGQAVDITLTDTGCAPGDLSLSAGPVVFNIRNDSSRVQEWEIIQGLMVVEERENIPPGGSQKLSARLKAGAYDLTCGPGSKLKPELRRKLTVTPGAGAVATGPEHVELVGALAEYRFFLLEETAGLQEAAQALVEAIGAGRLAEARAQVLLACRHYERILGVARRFNDLDGRIAVRAADLPAGEKDPGFTGLHRIGQGLFGAGTTAGLAAPARQLLADVGALEQRLKTFEVTGAGMVDGAVLQLQGALAIQSSPQGGPNAPDDPAGLADVQADLDGAGKVIEVLRPLLARLDKPLQARLDARLQAAQAELARHAAPDGTLPGAVALTPADRAALEAPLEDLIEDLPKARTVLGLD